MALNELCLRKTLPQNLENNEFFYLFISNEHILEKITEKLWLKLGQLLSISDLLLLIQMLPGKKGLHHFLTLMDFNFW